MVLTPAQIQANYRARQKILNPLETLKFTYKGKTYNLPEGFAQRDIPNIKKISKKF
jgi:hypothetical protein